MLLNVIYYCSIVFYYCSNFHGILLLFYGILLLFYGIPLIIIIHYSFELELYLRITCEFFSSKLSSTYLLFTE